jgi:signal transduction histidine kinase
VRGGLLPRTAIASGLLAMLVGGAFAVLIIAIEDLRKSARAAAHSRDALTAVDALERLVVDLETGVRGFVIAREERFLEPWNDARVAFPRQAARLARLEDDPEQAQLIRTITSDGQDYIDTYSVPLVRAARRGDPRARSVGATLEGKRRTDKLRANFDRLKTEERGLLNARQSRDDSNARRAVIAAAVGLGGSVLLIVLLEGYLARSIALPVRRAAGMASRLAGGDLAVRMPETGAGEIGDLERSFNAMARSLQTSRDELRVLAEEQAALRRVATLVARGVSPAELFSASTAEVAGLLGAQYTTLLRIEPDDTVTVMASQSERGPPAAIGTRLPLEGSDVTASVVGTGRPARMDSAEDVTGPLGALARAGGVRAAVAAPILVESRLWGVMVVGWSREEPAPPEAELRLNEFTELIATAIANADSREQLIASRARIVATADETRRRVVRDLHDGAQQRLVHAIVTLKLARRALEEGDDTASSLVDEALDNAQRANTEVRELAHGILPSALTGGGLRAGVDALVSRLHVPVTVDVSTDRLPLEIEASAYFVVAEALTNVAKHSDARSAQVWIWIEDGLLHVEVRDDGIGGARPDSSGLQGLDDRVAALGGRLRVASPPGEGTLVAATLPVPD